MWHQVHEMLYIERGGEEQIADELEAYNPLIPNGAERRENSKTPGVSTTMLPEPSTIRPVRD